MTEASNPTCDDAGDLALVTAQYTGEDCTATNNTQEGRAACSGDPAFADPVWIRASDKENPTDSRASVWFEGAVALDASFELSAAAAGQGRLKSNTCVHVYDDAGDLLQLVTFHTSCSKPLSTGDQFGSVGILGLNDLFASESAVTWSYEVRNLGDALSDVTVEDSQVGVIASGLTLGFGETRIFEYDAEALDTTTVTVLVTGSLADGGACGAADTATVTRVVPPEPPGSCADGKPAALTIQYTGEDCSATNNAQGTQDECAGDPAFATPVWIRASDKGRRKEGSEPSTWVGSEPSTHSAGSARNPFGLRRVSRRCRRSLGMFSRKAAETQRRGRPTSASRWRAA